MDSLRTLFRWMLASWLLLVVLLGGLVAQSSHSQATGNWLTFLFTETEEVAPLPPPPALAPAPQPAPKPPPPVAEPAPAPPPQSAEWIPLEQGRAAGRGVLGEVEIAEQRDGAVSVRFPCVGEPGNYRLYHPTNVAGLSVDLQGAWGKGMLVDHHLAGSHLTRVQIADHAQNGAQWLRISGVSRSGEPLEARVEYAPKAQILRIVFDVVP